MLTVEDMYDVRDSKREICTADPNMTVQAASQLMAKLNIGALPVVKGSRLVGIFSERDVMKRVVAKKLSVKTTKLKDVMTPDPISTTPDAPLYTVTEAMSEGHFRHMPIVDYNGDLLGIMSQRDFMTMTWKETWQKFSKQSLLVFVKGRSTFVAGAGIAAYIGVLALIF